MNYEDKKRLLLQIMETYCKRDVVIAFSGGIDSSLLLKLACVAAQKSKSTIYAVTIQSELQPKNDLKIAANVAAETGAKHVVLSIQELQETQIQNNPKERCYLCKKYLFKQLKQFAAQNGAEAIIEGTNEDDLHVYRPGIRAIRELGILSPLTEVHMTKKEVRMLAKEYGISVADRPSVPCLATRFPYGTKLTLDALQKVEQAEMYLQKFGNLRVRIHGDIVRIELEQEAMEQLMDQRKTVVAFLKQLGYHYITLDLEGFRSGSMDE